MIHAGDVILWGEVRAVVLAIASDRQAYVCDGDGNMAWVLLDALKEMPSGPPIFDDFTTDELRLLLSAIRKRRQADEAGRIVTLTKAEAQVLLKWVSAGGP